MFWAFFIPIAILIAALLLAKHRKSIEDQAYLDRTYVLRKYLAFSKLDFDYRFGKGDRIVSYEEVEKAKCQLLEASQLYNKKYKKYGFCIPPELFNFEEE